MLLMVFNIKGIILYQNKLDKYYCSSKVIKSNMILLNIPLEDISILLLLIEQAKK